MRAWVFLAVLGALTLPPAGGQTAPPALVVTGDAELDAAHGVHVGSGTAQDPFVLDDLRGRSRLELRDTKAHVVVRDLDLGTGPYQWFGAGILLTGTTNVTIEDVRVDSFQHGVHAVGVANLTVRDSDFNDQVFHAVFVEGGRGIVIERTTVRESQAGGIVLKDAREARIASNDLQEAGRTTGRISSSILLSESRDVEVRNNTVRDGRSSGVLLEHVERYDVAGNEVHGMGDNGLWIDSSTLGTVTGNSVFGSVATGLYFCTDGSAVADGNLLVGNNLGLDLAHVSGIVVSNNTIQDSHRKGLVIRVADDNRVVLNRFLHHSAPLPVIEVAGERNVFEHNVIEDHAGPAYWLVQGEGNLFDGQTLPAQGIFPEPEGDPGRNGPGGAFWLLALALAALAWTRRRGR